ncbi:hypothetical protein QJQ45_020196, partial [Haematococcus lacustris]
MFDRGEAGQPELNDAQRRRKASGKARAARVRDNTFHGRKCKLAQHLPQELWDAFLADTVQPRVKACGEGAVIGSLLLDFLVWGLFTLHAAVQLDAQSQPQTYTDTDIPVSEADIPDLSCDNLFRQLCRGLPGDGENTRPSAAVAAVLSPTSLSRLWEPVLGQGQGEVARDAEHEGEGDGEHEGEGDGEHEGAWQEGEQGEWEGGEGEEWEGYEEGWEEGEYEEYAASNAAWQAECEAAQWQQPGGSAGWPEGAESTEGLGQLQEEGDEGDHPLKFTELCSHWAAYGDCPHGLHCRMVHGEECETCHKRLIHPFNPDLASEHAIECIARHEKLEAHLRSAAVECGICYERVLSAPNPSDRRFGLMSCDHAFCLTCIRTWRASNAADTEA